MVQILNQMSQWAPFAGLTTLSWFMRPNSTKLWWRFFLRWTKAGKLTLNRDLPLLQSAIKSILSLISSTVSASQWRLWDLCMLWSGKQRSKSKLWLWAAQLKEKSEFCAKQITMRSWRTSAPIQALSCISRGPNSAKPTTTRAKRWTRGCKLIFTGARHKSFFWTRSTTFPKSRNYLIRSQPCLLDIIRASDRGTTCC